MLSSPPLPLPPPSRRRVFMVVTCWLFQRLSLPVPPWWTLTSDQYVLWVYVCVVGVRMCCGCTYVLWVYMCVVCVCMCCGCTCVYTCECMGVCVHVYLCVCVRMCMCVHACIHVYVVLSYSPVHTQSLYGNTILVGGNSLLPGFTERMTRELNMNTPPVSSAAQSCALQGVCGHHSPSACVYIYTYVAWKYEITSNHQIQNTCEDS